VWRLRGEQLLARLCCQHCVLEAQGCRADRGAQGCDGRVWRDGCEGGPSGWKASAEEGWVRCRDHFLAGIELHLTTDPPPSHPPASPKGHCRCPVSCCTSAGSECSSVCRRRFQVAKYRVSLQQCSTRSGDGQAQHTPVGTQQGAPVEAAGSSCDAFKTAP
jgi:hypothetical protein